MGKHVDQRGISIIAVVIMMLIMAVMGAVLISLVGTESTSSIGQMRGSQAFYIAEGGSEYGQRFMTDTANWYFFTADPYTIATNQPLGAGTFTDALNLPATALSRNIGSGNTTICVFSAARFPVPATVQINDEIIACSGTGACSSTAAFTGCVRGGGLGATPHSIGTEVYPETTLSAAISNTATTVTVGSTAKFLAAGTVQIGNPGGAFENARYNGIDATHFYGVVRGVNGTGAAAWGAGIVVTPLQNTGALPPLRNFQALITSTGTVGNAQRIIQAVTEK
jgi:hypothetical protein